MKLLAFTLALTLLVSGCSSNNVTSRCWGDEFGVNYCTHFVQQYFWTGAVAITDSRDDKGRLMVSDQLSVSTGIVSSLGGSVAGEAAQHLVIAP